MTVRSHRAAVALVAVLLVLAMGADVAHAGTYTVYSCHTPSGRSVSTEGWLAQNTIGEPTSITSANDCSSPAGALHANLIGNGFARRAYHDSAGWVFRPPAGTAISGFRAALCGLPAGTNEAVVVSWPTETYPSPQGLQALFPSTMGCVGTTSQWQSPGNYVSGWGFSTTALWFSVICTSTNLCDTNDERYGGYLHIYSFAGSLVDPSAPAVSAVSGPLASNATHQGTETVTFNAADQGSGVYRAIAEAKIHGGGDWRTLATHVADANGGKCAPDGETGNPYEFDALVPCRASVSGASLTLDTSQLPPGDHTLRVVVEDAAGNRSDVIAPRIFHVNGLADNATPSSASRTDSVGPLAAVNGIGASRTALVQIKGSASRRIRYASHVTIGGRVLDAQAQPIAGAALEVQSRTLVPKTGLADGSWQTIGQVTTTKTGAFSARLPAGASRNVLFVYKANPSDPGWTSTAQVNVVVSARTTLRVRRARVRNHHSAVFLGRIAGTIPKAGVLMTLQVKEGTRWIPVATNHQPARSNANGKFRIAYRFQRTTRPATFRFRVLVNEDSAFPYDEGYSKTVKVHVRP